MFFHLQTRPRAKTVNLVPTPTNRPPPDPARAAAFPRLSSKKTFRIVALRVQTQRMVIVRIARRRMLLTWQSMSWKNVSMRNIKRALQYLNATRAC